MPQNTPKASPWNTRAAQSNLRLPAWRINPSLLAQCSRPFTPSVSRPKSHPIRLGVNTLKALSARGECSVNVVCFICYFQSFTHLWTLSFSLCVCLCPMSSIPICLSVAMFSSCCLSLKISSLSISACTTRHLFQGPLPLSLSSQPGSLSPPPLHPCRLVPGPHLEPSDIINYVPLFHHSHPKQHAEPKPFLPRHCFFSLFSNNFMYLFML